MCSNFELSFMGFLVQANEKELKEALQSQLEEQKQLFEAAEKEKLYLLTLIQELRNQLQTQQ